MTVWTIPDGITEITRGYVIDNMPEGTTEIEIPDGVKSIGDAAFNGHTNLQSVVIPEGVRSIGSNAFQSCESLKSIVIPESVECIGAGAFRGCTSLKSVVIPGRVKSICDLAFYGCESLKSVVISDGVERIGSDVFSGCRALNLIILPDVLVANRAEYGISANQTVIKYSDFIEWKGDNGLVGKSYSDQAILFLYQLQNIESFKPSWNEVLKQCPEVGVEDMLYFSARTDLHHQLTTVVSIYREEVKIGDNLIKDEIMSYLNIADLPEYESSEVNILTSQSLFSRLCSEVQSLKVLGISGSAALAIAIGIGYMQRYDGGKYSA